MKKAFVIFIAIQIMFSTMGFIFAAHFCGDEMKSASVIVDATSSCCEMDAKEVEQSEKAGCCKDELKLYKISDQFIPSELFHFDYPLFAIQINKAITPILVAFKVHEANSVFEFPPGQLQQAKIISTSVLRI